MSARWWRPARLPVVVLLSACALSGCSSGDDEAEPAASTAAPPPRVQQPASADALDSFAVLRRARTSRDELPPGLAKALPPGTTPYESRRLTTRSWAVLSEDRLCLLHRGTGALCQPRMGPSNQAVLAGVDCFGPEKGIEVVGLIPDGAQHVEATRFDKTTAPVEPRGGVIELQAAHGLDALPVRLSWTTSKGNGARQPIPLSEDTARVPCA